MAVIGTFGSFTAARLGIYAAQSSLNVTGNNIANINTKGYTRQRADLVSLHSAGSARIASGFNLDIGYGVLINNVSQLRDPFLDIRYRDEQASVGYYEARMNGLQQISNILDEVGKGKNEFGLLEGQFSDFLIQLQSYNNRINDETYDTTVRASAESLVTQFNTYAKALERVKDNQLEDLKDDVESVNTILTKIRELNVQIRQAGLYHENALELRDERNVLIDDLSAYMKIEVQYSMEPIDEFSSVEKLSITLADSGNPPTYLINGIYGTQLRMPEQDFARNPYYDADNPVTMRYVSRETDLKANPPKIVYTNLEREALVRVDGSLLRNDDAGWTDLCARDGVDKATLDLTYYDENATDEDGHLISGQYLDKDGNPTDHPVDPDDLVDNAVKGSDKNRLWMHLEPLVDEKGRYIKDEYGRDIDEIVELGDTDLFGSLQAKRELLTREGEFASAEDIAFDPDANIKRGIPYFQRALDALARKFATEFNNANTAPKDPNKPDDPDGRKPVLVGYETITDVKGIERYKVKPGVNCILSNNVSTYTTKDGVEVDLSKWMDYKDRVDLTGVPDDIQAVIREMQQQHLANGTDGDPHGYPVLAGGILFSVRGDSNDIKDANGVGITAANISISKDWSFGSVRLLPSKNFNLQEHSTADDNIYHMIDLMGENLGYTANEIKDIVSDADKGDDVHFKGSFQQYLSNINVTLSTAQQVSTTVYTGYATTSLNLDNQRQSVSGVDLNEEATSMMVFQKSYAAACQLMTTLDSMLDKLINGTI